MKTAVTMDLDFKELFRGLSSEDKEELFRDNITDICLGNVLDKVKPATLEYYMDRMGYNCLTHEDLHWFKTDNIENPDKPYIDKAGMIYTTDGYMIPLSKLERLIPREK